MPVSTIFLSLSWAWARFLVSEARVVFIVENPRASTSNSFTHEPWGASPEKSIRHTLSTSRPRTTMILVSRFEKIRVRGSTRRRRRNSVTTTESSMARNSASKSPGGAVSTTSKLWPPWLRVTSRLSQPSVRANPSVCAMTFRLSSNTAIPPRGDTVCESRKT